MNTTTTFSNDYYVNAYHMELRADRSTATSPESTKRRRREKKR